MDGDRTRGPHDDSASAQARIIVRAAWRPGHPSVGRPSAYLDGSIAVSSPTTNTVCAFSLPRS